MHEAVKHTAGTALALLGFFGSISLAQVNLIVSITCGVFGTVAAICTINSWWRKRNG